jgi:hypothetical protein
MNSSFAPRTGLMGKTAMKRTRALRGRQGVVGFIPIDALIDQSDLVAVEVVVELVDAKPRSVEVPVRVSDIEKRLRAAEPGAGVRDIRGWISDRAVTRLILREPPLDGKILRAETMYWVCHRPHRREPFLR